jgi:hypothetical protein
MAMRSHLYATDFIPPRSTGQRPPRGLNEHKSSIPLVHQIMIASEPRVVHSEIWPQHEIAVIAKREGADDRLLALFDKLATSASAELVEEIERTRQFLAKEEKRSYVLLEPGEIYELEGSDAEPRAWMRAQVNEAQRVNARVDRALAGGDDAFLADVRENWRDHMGWWSHVLYFSFPDPGA